MMASVPVSCTGDDGGESGAGDGGTDGEDGKAGGEGGIGLGSGLRGVGGGVGDTGGVGEGGGGEGAWTMSAMAVGCCGVSTTVIPMNMPLEAAIAIAALTRAAADCASASEGVPMVAVAVIESLSDRLGG
eukprot:2003477-Prymnesium_polylepis.1